MERHIYLRVILFYLLAAFAPITESNQLVPYSGPSTSTALEPFRPAPLPVSVYNPPSVHMPILPVTTFNLPTISNPYQNPSQSVVPAISTSHHQLPAVLPAPPLFSQLGNPSGGNSGFRLDPNIFNINLPLTPMPILTEIQNRMAPPSIIMPITSPPPTNTLLTKARHLGYNFVQRSVPSDVSVVGGSVSGSPSISHHPADGAGARIRQVLQRCKRGLYPADDDGNNYRPPSDEYRFMKSAFDAEDTRQRLEGDNSYMQRFEKLVKDTKSEKEKAGERFDGRIDWTKFPEWSQPNYASAVAEAHKFTEEAYKSEDVATKMAATNAMKDIENVVRQRDRTLKRFERQRKADPGHVTAYNSWRNKLAELHTKYEKDGIFRNPPPPKREYNRGPERKGKGGERKPNRSHGCPY